VNRTTIKIGQESKPEIRLAGLRRGSRVSPRPWSAAALIGIVAHQCHETSDIAAQPGSDDRMGAYPEIVPKFGQHNLGQIKTSVAHVHLSARPFRAENGAAAVR
jgi:hypothetical protein